MHIESIHTRRLTAAPGDVDGLLRTLGGAGDRLWPNERWATTRLTFDAPPTAIGVKGRHGKIGYHVEQYEPERLLRLRFDPDSGLDGTHAFEIDGNDDGGTVLRHVLDARLRPRLVPLARPLRAYHDAIIEDLLDNAERATGTGPIRPARGKRWVRTANALEVGIAQTLDRRGPLDQRARMAHRVVPPVLLAIAALHAAWALGSSWPSDDERALAQAVLSGAATEMPPGWASWAVAGTLTGAAGLVQLAGGHHPARWVRRMTLGAAGMFLFRGAVYIPVDLANGLASRYDRLDLALYSPLCLALGAGTWAVARRHGSRETERRSRSRQAPKSEPGKEEGRP